MIFQDPYSSLNPRMRVDQIIAEPIEHHKLASGRQETYAIVANLLEVVGLGQAAGRKFPHEFSGGQRQRISIARALATRPRFLICDEPTSALDVSIQAQVLNLLKDLRAGLNLTVLFISHDLPDVRQMGDRIAVMRHGEICELAETEDLFHPAAASIHLRVAEADAADLMSGGRSRQIRQGPPPGHGERLDRFQIYICKRARLSLHCSVIFRLMASKTWLLPSSEVRWRRVKSRQ